MSIVKYAPGMRIIVRDEEWMIKKVESNEIGNKSIYCVGISPLFKLTVEMLNKGEGTEQSLMIICLVVLLNVRLRKKISLSDYSVKNNYPNVGRYELSNSHYAVFSLTDKYVRTGKYHKMLAKLF